MSVQQSPRKKNANNGNSNPASEGLFYSGNECISNQAFFLLLKKKKKEGKEEKAQGSSCSNTNTAMLKGNLIRK